MRRSRSASISRNSAERRIICIYSLSSSLLSACFLLALVFPEPVSGIPMCGQAESQISYVAKAKLVLGLSLPGHVFKDCVRSVLQMCGQAD